MNFIWHNLHLKITCVWSLIINNPQILYRFGFIFLFLPIFTFSVGHVRTVEPSLATTKHVISTPWPASSAAPDSRNSIPASSYSGRIELFAQSQITPTITSYPDPLSPTSYPRRPSPTANPTDNPREGKEEPYPDLAPDSIKQPLIPYPDSLTGQSPGLNPELTQTPPSQNPISPPAIGSNTNGNAVRSSDDLAQTSSAVSTTILWIAFLASLLIFVSAILWSILYFSRQRGRD